MTGIAPFLGVRTQHIIIQTEMPAHQFFKKYGYNVENFIYPFPEGSEILDKWKKRSRFVNNHI